MTIRGIEQSFSGGELTPEFFGRLADAKYQAGLAVCRNFVCLPHGPVANRAGFGFVREVQNSANKTWVRPFAYSTTQTMVLELGTGYMRFHTQGASLLCGTVTAWSSLTNYVQGGLVSLAGVNYYCIAANINQAPPNATYWYPEPANGVYEIPTPYASVDIGAISYVQSQDVLTLVHPNYPPMELRRQGAVQWVLTTISFASSLVPPTGLAAVPTVTGTGLTVQDYVVTALGGTANDESLQSVHATCSNNLNAVASFNTLTWSAVTGAIFYNVYKLSNGLYGFIGTTSNLTFADNNIVSDLSQTPPLAVNPFASSGNYPGAVTYFDQRRCFGGTLNQPQNFWGTQSGTENNLQFSVPTRDADSIQFKIAALSASTIRHLLPMNSLLIMASSVEYQMNTGGNIGLVPGGFSLPPQSYVGSSVVKPLIVNSNVLFASARGGHIREMTYNLYSGGFQTSDLSLRAPHLFDNLTIVDSAFSKSPYPIAWFVSANGTLLGNTYVPEQQVAPWHRHDTINGLFESICVVAEGNEDVLYAVINRTIQGVAKRYIERLASRFFLNQSQCFFVDAGLTYSGAPATVITGLDHLNGQTVSILGDGAVRPQQVVGPVGGGIGVTLDQPASFANIGLPITAQLQTLPLAFDAQGLGQGRTKNIVAVWLRVFNSLGIFVGQSFDKLFEAKIRTTENFDNPPALRTGEVEVKPGAAWEDSGQVCVQQNDPLPLTIVSMSLEAAIGG
jgi:hypothetical protein